MTSSRSNNDFSYRERILVAPVPTAATAAATPARFLHVRMESAMTVRRDNSDTATIKSITPFPRQVREILQHHNATRILIQVGTSSSHTYGLDQNPLDAVDPWHSFATTTSSSTATSLSRRRLDFGPSGVLVRATLKLPIPTSSSMTLDTCQSMTADDLMKAWGRTSPLDALLQDLVARRIVLAPLFSVSIRRLHRHSILSVSCTTTSNDASNTTLLLEVDYELVLPTEGAALSSEGMHAFATTFCPCHNQSGIFSWNDPTTTSEFFVKRESTARHSWWIQMENINGDDAQGPEEGKFIRVVKGLQFQPLLLESTNNNGNTNRTVALADLFPSSIRHRRCPFVQESTLETVVSAPMELIMTALNEEQQQQQPLLEYFDNHGNAVQVQELTPKNWKDPWMALLSASSTHTPEQQQQPRWSVHQTLQRPRGVAYSGRLITQAVVHPSSTASSSNNDRKNCHVSVDLQWFLPPVVQPTWQSLRVVWENDKEQVEQELDWRRDLDGTITWINEQPGDDGTIHFRIPQWNVTSSTDTAAADATQTLTIFLDYRPAFLSFEHFPGDANRGVEIPPAMASFVETCHPTTQQPSSSPILLYSNSLLLLPPVPDMSMPFNVLSMTCSLYAFIIGSLLNLLIRKSSERVQRTYDPSKVPPPSKLQQLKAKIQQAVAGKLKRFKRGKQDGNKADAATKETSDENADVDKQQDDQGATTEDASS